MLLALASLAAATPRGEVGVGLVGPFLNPPALSLQAIGRLPLSSSVRVELSARAPLLYDPVTEVHELVGLVAVEAGQSIAVPVTGEPAAVSALVDWGFGARPRAGRLTGGLHFLGGPELRLALDYVGTPGANFDFDDPSTFLDLSEPTPRLVVGVAHGFGLYAHVGDRVTLRLTLLDHLALEPRRAWDEEGTRGELALTSAAATSLDVVVAL